MGSFSFFYYILGADRMLRIVDYDKYCWKCKAYTKSESESPCWECLEVPANDDSHRPLYFKEADEKELARRKKERQKEYEEDG